MSSMISFHNRKVVLSDYDAQRDIRNRLMMSEFSARDIHLLDEIIGSSLKISLEELADRMETDISSLIANLDKLSKTGLFRISGRTIDVDKEMRKYFECQLTKFDDEFLGGMDYLQALLTKVPVHVLPSWYAIPRTSDNIFFSLVEKYLSTPRKYLRYLMELEFDDPVLDFVVEQMRQGPHEILVDELKMRFMLSAEQCATLSILLEFHFVAYLGYRMINGHWKEVLKPFSEWAEYNAFLKNTQPKNLQEGVLPLRDSEFSFVEDMAAILGKTQGSHGLAQPYVDHLLHKAFLLKLLEKKGDRVELGICGMEWLDLKDEERAAYIYKNPRNRFFIAECQSLDNEKNVREVEKSLERLQNAGWVDFEEFFKGFTAAVGTAEGLCLRKTGKRWAYERPQYSAKEKAFIKATIFERLFEGGIVKIGTHNNKDCFCLTVFGRLTLGQ